MMFMIYIRKSLYFITGKTKQSKNVVAMDILDFPILLTTVVCQSYWARSAACPLDLIFKNSRASLTTETKISPTIPPHQTLFLKWLPSQTGTFISWHQGKFIIFTKTKRTRFLCIQTKQLRKSKTGRTNYVYHLFECNFQCSMITIFSSANYNINQWIVAQIQKRYINL